LKKGFHLQVHFCFAEAVWDKIAQTFQVHPAIFLFQKGNSAAGWKPVPELATNKRQQGKSTGIVFFYWWHTYGL
jgi:hypothetical protein